MNHAAEIQKFIDLAAQEANFARQGFREFEKEEPEALVTTLQASELFFTTSVLGMKSISYIIEDQALNLNSPFRFYSGFQKLSRLKLQEERYRRLVAQGYPVYVFGLPDAPVSWTAPNMEIITLDLAKDEELNLTQNWFVILDHPKMVSMALISRELPMLNRPPNASTNILYRNFEGFWTYNREVIVQVMDVLNDYIRQNTPGSPSPN
jgi:DICT domain-containing protein